MAITGSTRPDRRRAWEALRPVAVWALAALALGVVFLAYQHPGMVMQLAQQLWACF